MQNGFPIKVLTAAVVLTMVFFVGVGWYVWDSYQAFKAIGTEQVTAVLQAHVQANLDARRRLAFFAIAATGVVLPSLLFAWLGALRLVRRHVAARQRAQEELRLAKEAAEEGRQLVEQLYRLAISVQTSGEREDRLRAFIQ